MRESVCLYFWSPGGCLPALCVSNIDPKRKL